MACARVNFTFTLHIVLSAADGAISSESINRVGYLGAKIYYTCVINFKKYTSKCLAECIRIDLNSFCFWNWWDNKIKSPNVRFTHTNFFRSPASTQPMCYHTLPFLAFSPVTQLFTVFITIFNQPKARLFLILFFITNLVHFMHLSLQSVFLLLPICVFCMFEVNESLSTTEGVSITCF